MSTASIPFIKASACGNDFLVIDATHRPADASSFSRRICDRHNGIGADGVEWISPGGVGADVVAELINADGSPAEVSGNGTRCVAACWVQREKARGDLVRVQTGAGVKECRLTAQNGNEFGFEMKMGAPEVQGECVLRFGGESVRGLKIWMGNPQFAVFVEAFDFPWQACGAAIQSRRSEFPEGVNVDFVRVVDPQTIESRFFERGAGETMSSGTGSCASAVAAVHAGRVKSPVLVKAPGGAQTVRWEGDVYLQGPARIIGSGEFFI